MRRGSRKGKHKEQQEKEGRWESGAREAQSSRERASPAYDSDSYENHVIDLREEDKELGFRGMDSREDEIQEEEQITGSEGDSYEGDKDGSTAEATSGSPDGEVESSQGHLHLPMSNNCFGDPIAADIQLANRRSAGYDSRLLGDQGRSGISKVVHTGEGGSKNVQFHGGEVVWAKFARFPWWPAQVQDEKDLNEDFKGDKPGVHNIAVRFFGTYDYAWVDPTVGLSRFDVKLQERSRTRKKALTKGVEEAIEFRATGKLPPNWDSTASELEQNSQRAEANGVKSPKSGSLRVKSQSEEPEQRRAARTRKPKVLFEVCHTAGARKNGAKVKERSLKEDIGYRRPERKLRRIRIMRYLGLAAPYGSPFTLEGGRTCPFQSLVSQ